MVLSGHPDFKISVGLSCGQQSSRAQETGDTRIISTESLIKWTVSPSDRLYMRREGNKTPKIHTFKEWEEEEEPMAGGGCEEETRVVEGTRNSDPKGE